MKEIKPVIGAVPETVVFLNPKGEIVIKQDGGFIYFPPVYAKNIIAAIERAAKGVRK